MIWKLATSKPFLVGRVRYEGAGPWMMDRQQAGSVLAQVDPIGIEAENFSPLDSSQDWNGKTILVMRGGGIGDLLLSTPMLRELKRRWPDCKIAYSCHKSYAEVITGNGLVDEVWPYPLPLPGYHYDGIVWLGGVIEDNPESEKRHACDVMADRAGIEIADYSIALPPVDSWYAATNFPKSTWHRRIGIQLSASAMCRSISSQTLARVMLEMSDCEFVIFASPGESSIEDLPRIVNLGKRKLTFMRSCAVASTCDALLTPDSAMFHAGGALRVPTLGIFGPFDPALRVTSDCQTYWQGTAPCAPCFHHTSQTQFPLDKPCAVSGNCAAMESVTTAMIISKLREIME